jgi:hypothetical protein
MIGEWEYAPLFFVGISSYGTYYKASDSNYTVVTLSLENYNLPSLSTGGKIDFEVMALIGNEYPTTEQGGTVYGFDGEESVWSAQTIVIPEPSTSISPSPTTSPTPSPSPTQQSTPSPTPILISSNYEGDLNSLLIILGTIALAVSITAVVVVFLIKHRRFT